VDQAIAYCKKDGLFTERGRPPIDQEEALRSGRSRANDNFREIIARAQRGDFQWIIDNHPAMWIARHASLRSMYKPTPAILDGDLEHEWWVGDTGSGKSSTAWTLYPSHYQKQLNKWWDGYEDNEVVIIEEWCPRNDVSGSQLKIWADRYPFPGQIKGGTLQGIRPKKIIVLSNYTIRECFANDQDRDPILRRFTTIQFPEESDVAHSRAAAFHELLSAEQLQQPATEVASSPLPTLPLTNSTGSSSSTSRSDILEDEEVLAFLNDLLDA